MLLPPELTSLQSPGPTGRLWGCGPGAQADLQRSQRWQEREKSDAERGSIRKDERAALLPLTGHEGCRGRRWLLRQRVSLIKGEVQRVQAAGASDKWMGSKSPVVAGLGPHRLQACCAQCPAGKGAGSFPGKGGHWAESICQGSSASFRPQHLEVQPRWESRKYPLWHCSLPIERGRK